MIWFGWFRRDRDGLKRAEGVDADAAEQLRRAREDLEQARLRVEEVRTEWPKTVENGKRTAEILGGGDSLSRRFWDHIEGGKPA